MTDAEPAGLPHRPARLRPGRGRPPRGEAVADRRRGRRPRRGAAPTSSAPCSASTRTTKAALTNQKPMPPAEPTFHDFGKRVGRILAMAEEEAEEMRTAAVAEVHAQPGRGRARTSAPSAPTPTSTPQRRASRRGRGGGAHRRGGQAQRRPDGRRGRARWRSPRSDEAEALYEEQRARAAKAAADFEQTLAERRDTGRGRSSRTAPRRPSASWTRRRNRVAQAARRGRPAAGRGARRAGQITADAEQQGRADRGRRDGARRADPRRSPSASSPPPSQRRNAINAQLTNVRQMLATLSGTSAAAEDPTESRRRLSSSPADPSVQLVGEREPRPPRRPRARRRPRAARASSSATRA